MEPAENKCFIVDEQSSEMRLDLYLAQQEPGYTRSYWQKMCRQGNVTINGQAQTKPAFKLKPGQMIQVHIPAPQAMVADPENIPLEIIYEDQDLLVVNKPKGMVVHPAAGHRTGTLVNALLFHCQQLPAVGEKLRPGIVHRLDKDTTGLLVVAKDELSFGSLARQLKDREMKREYLAVVHGQPRRTSGTVNATLGRDPVDRKKFTVREAGAGRPAITHYQVLKILGPYSLLSLKLETGRTHQIRVHLAYLKCPVVGDPLYGPQKSPYRNMGQLLHAGTLGFQHPKSNEYMEFMVEPGDEFKNFLARGENYECIQNSDN